MKQRVTTTTSLLVIALISLAAAVGVYVFGYHLVSSAHTDLDAMRTEYDALVRERKHHAEVQDLAETLQSAGDELEGYLLASDDPIEFLSLIEQIGRDSGVALEVESIEKNEQAAVKPKKGEVTPDPQVKVVLSVAGAWSGVYHLIALLETMPYALSIEHVALQEQKTEEIGVHAWEGQIHLQIKIKNQGS